MSNLESRLAKFCVGCGACQAICPRNAIDLSSNENGLLSLHVDLTKCTDCKLCMKVCPILYDVFNEPTVLSEKDFIGHYYKIFVAHASDERTRWGGASGGLVSALILKMLESGIINGALVSKMEGPGNINTFIARNAKDILDAQGSIYFPTFAARQIKSLKASKGSYAVVGTPCQVRAIKRAAIFSPELSKKIYIYLGLFCYHVNEFWYLDYFERKIVKVKPEEVLEIGPRRGGWPGSIEIKNFREKKKIPFFSFWGALQLLYLTSPVGCLFCSDHTNMMSDLSFGDAWFPTLMKTDAMGSSLVVARTKKGLSSLREAKNDGLIVLREITEKDLLESQRSIFYKKFFVSAARSFVQRKMIFSPKKYVGLLPLMHAAIARRNSIRKLIYIIPPSFLGKYAYVLHKIIEYFE